MEATVRRYALISNDDARSRGAVAPLDEITWGAIREVVLARAAVAAADAFGSVDQPGKRVPATGLPGRVKRCPCTCRRRFGGGAREPVATNVLEATACLSAGFSEPEKRFDARARSR